MYIAASPATIGDAWSLGVTPEHIHRWRAAPNTLQHHRSATETRLTPIDIFFLEKKKDPMLFRQEN
jgi:hypothetical protein